MVRTPPPFAPFEWMIAWRYLRARRAEGGISTMTLISLIGIALAVFALVATLAIRTGLRQETVRSILGANAHLSVSAYATVSASGARETVIRDFDQWVARLSDVPGIDVAVPVATANLIGNLGQNNAPIDLHGIRLPDLEKFTSIAAPERGSGDIERLGDGIALGSRLAASLGAGIGDRIRVISPNGVRTAFGVSPRVSAYEVVYIFQSGQHFVDRTRAYLPLSEAQSFLNRDDAVDRIDVLVSAPEEIERLVPAVSQAIGAEGYVTTWRDRAGGFLRALQMQDNALYILLSILVLIAAMNIVSGLIMLVKNKGRDIGILRTMGLTQGAILRVFFIVGASIGTVATFAGVVLGILFAANIDLVYSLLDLLTGSGKAQLEAQGFFFPPAVLRAQDILAAVSLSLGLSFLVTVFPARRAARMDPVEALRYE